MNPCVANTLTISGREWVIRNFLDHNRGRGQALTFEAAIPYPEEFARLDRLREEFDRDHPDAAPWEGPACGAVAGGVAWCLQFWGTAWDAVDPMMSPDDLSNGTVTINFKTASSPPLSWLRIVAGRWPDATFRLDARNHKSGWCVEAEYSRGRKVHHREREVNVRARPVKKVRRTVRVQSQDC